MTKKSFALCEIYIKFTYFKAHSQKEYCMIILFENHIFSITKGCVNSFQFCKIEVNPVFRNNYFYNFLKKF